MHPSRKVYHYRKQNDDVPAQVSAPAPELHIPVEIKELWQQQKALHKKIHEIDNRLRFGYSEALYDYKVQLIREDVILACQVNTVLLAKKKT